MGILLSFILVTQVNLAEEMTTEDSNLEVIIHRLIVKSSDTIIQNEGKPIDVEHLKEMKGLNDVTFSIYDITDRLDTLLQKGMTLEEAQLKLIRSTYSLVNLTLLNTVVTETYNGEDGLAKATLPINKARKQAFLIIETDTKTKETTKSDQIVLVTPVYDQFGKQMDTVHIYPKSILEEVKPDKGDKEATPPISNSKRLPNTGEIIQSKIFLLGLTLLTISSLWYYFTKLSKKKIV